MNKSIKPVIFEFQTQLSAVELFSLFRYRAYSFFLDSSMIDPKLGRYSYFGFDPFLVFQSKEKQIEITQGKTYQKFTGSALNELGKLLDKYHLQNRPDLAPFLGGAVGLFSYEFGRQLEILPELNMDDLNIPDCLFGFYDLIFIFDHLTQRSWIISSGFPEQDFVSREKKAWKRVSDALALIHTIEKNPMGKVISRPNETLLHSEPIESNFTKEQYFSIINMAKDYIASGDIYQVNLSQRFSTRWENSSWDLYLRLRHFNPAPFSVYLNGKDFSILSSSPERFFRISQDEIETRPIKGTRPRGKTVSEDNRYRNELLKSEKDRAELVMIVDLERNDIGKVCEYGSVNVAQFPELESYATVWHLVGTIRGKLRKNISPLECISACFPGGSITGAPKIRAMEIIEELESHRRGIYTGSIGYVGFNKESDFNIAIRTMILKNQKLYFHSGGGIVADSDPEMEYEETLHKAKALFQAIKEIPDIHTFSSLHYH